MRVLTILLGTWCAGTAWGQAPWGAGGAAQPKPGANAEGNVVLRSETRLVQLNVIVETKKGRLVEDLKKEDFTLLDNGKEQKIALFATESAKAPGTASPESQAKNTQAPNAFGNRLRHSEEPPGSVTVILFDALNTSFTDQAYARTQILAFLRQLQPQDHVAIYLLTSHLRVINEFTQDSKSLLEAIKRFQLMPSLMLANSSELPMSPSDTGITDPKGAQRVANLLNDMHSKLSDVADVERVEITARAVEAIANHVAGIPGRKNLVWISGAFPVSISLTSNDNSPVDSRAENFTPQLERVARALNQSNMAIYPVDARGLLMGSATDASVAHPFSPYRTPGDMGIGQSEQSTMDLLANRTGGHAYYNTNDIKGAIRRTLNDSRFTYTIGYYPDHGNWNGEYHTIQLRGKKSGVVLRYRKGYFALADPPENAAATYYALQAAVWSPVDATSLGIEARVEAIYIAVRKLDLRVKVETGDLRLKETDGRRRGSVDAIYMQLGPGDAVLGVEPVTYKLDFGEKEYQAALAKGYELKAPLTIQGATRNLRVVVRDAASGFLGSVTVPLERFLPAVRGGK
jgi:VWFA-related protein